ncbi:hypothetical protein EHF33_04735 [Deinococcus psychrotolerans]|uniref:Intracellular proteinase inhibitor BsuPI domain-containing protein n=1 Tax=Deinococcus psychrotolerans TaxID=2489213 RepID=A0A3G8YAF5_9DEIO|nr:hypothetical protein [Deinococcus psychrotolerans]AZI42135.1 hypothetical protein EHF33_04735 [Deinococcus psychrotolerans]
MNKLLPLLLLGLLSLPAAAQSTLPEIPPVGSQPAVPLSTSAPTLPDTNNMAARAVRSMEGVSAILQIPRTVGTEFSISLTLKNGQLSPMNFSAGRDSDQNCAAVPSIRVLQVGTREVVYPTGDKRICTQEMVERTAAAGGSATFERTLKLPAGEYMVEGWFQGFAGEPEQTAKISAQPVRISVK